MGVMSFTRFNIAKGKTLLLSPEKKRIKRLQLNYVKEESVIEIAGMSNGRFLHISVGQFASDFIPSAFKNLHYWFVCSSVTFFGGNVMWLASGT